VVSSCLKVSGSYDLSNLDIGCKSAEVTGLRELMGTWKANVDGTFTDHTYIKGFESWTMELSCLVLPPGGVVISTKPPRQSIPGALPEFGAGPLEPVECEIEEFVPYRALQAFTIPTATCIDRPAGGCACDVRIEQQPTDNQAGIGFGLRYQDLQPTGRYTISGNTLTLGDTLNYSYCVSGDSLTLSPQSTSPTLTGTIVLKKASGT
jgi:hypothetical protein